MRKVIIIAAGVATFAALTVAASARQLTCNERMTTCEDYANMVGAEPGGLARGREENHRCAVDFSQCFHDGSWGYNAPKGTYNRDPNAPDNKIGGKVGSKVSYANGTNPDGTPKLTDTPPSGGNGKYTTVAMPDGSTVQVAQGIPGGAYIVQNGKAVPFERVIDGVHYNVSSVGYAAVAQKIQPGIDAKANAASAIASGTANVRDHRTDPKPPTAGSPPPAAAPGTASAASTTNTPGPAVRDHRAGGNAANTTVVAKTATAVTAKAATAVTAKTTTAVAAKASTAAPAAMARQATSASLNDHGASNKKNGK